MYYRSISFKYQEYKCTSINLHCDSSSYEVVLKFLIYLHYKFKYSYVLCLTFNFNRKSYNIYNIIKFNNSNHSKKYSKYKQTRKK